MAEDIKDAYGLSTELIKGRGGIFEVTVKNDVIYDKQEAGGRFPSNKEIIEKLQKFVV